jgi:protein-L-isoaspartate(D-aspartate) O-methyltransferase
MIISPESAILRRQLVEELQKQGALHDPAIAAAFEAIPRELFVPLFYRKDGNEWYVYSRDVRRDEWLQMMYQDEALITLLNAEHIPISSSSQPSIMAEMLSALAIEPGMQVLEIGTGTGYNAALLAHLTGDPALVTTIDLDPRLVEQAARTLHALVGPVNVLAGNGCDIRLAEPLDRIIVTASVTAIPKQWYQQLAVGGRLVLPLTGSLGASALLVVEKHGEQGSGFFSPVPIAFMPMRTLREEASMPSVRELLALPFSASFRVEEEEEKVMITYLSDEHFRWFAQWSWPSSSLSILPMTLVDGRQAFQIKDPSAPAILQLTCAADGSWSGRQRGAFPLYQHLMNQYRTYEHLDRPQKHVYQVQCTQERCSLCVVSAREQIMVREALFS